ncbi:MAG: hypothetical protein SWO11_20510 [Thermodesulfobacteriota bacterium]|nr:hypothetical protein [Thermodesulfobacteriota bacterium]
MKGFIEKIKLLEHLTYIPECAGLDYIGEAKYEMDFLTEKFENAQYLSKEEKNHFITTLNKAHELLMITNSQRAAGLLSQISRALWEEVMNELPYIKQNKMRIRR